MGVRTFGARTSLWVAALAPAAMFGLYAARPAFPIVLTAVLVPWTILYTDPRWPKRPLVFYAVGAWVAWQALYPQAWSYGAAAAVIMGTACWVLWLPFAPVLRALHARFGLPRTLTVPVVWVGLEWMRAAFTVGHFDLYALGYSRARFPAMIQIADITGVYGVSFLVAATNGFLADVYFSLRDARWRFDALPRDRRLLRTAAALAACALAVLAYGTVRLARIRLEPGPRVAVVQPNVLHTLRNVRGALLAQLILSDEQVPDDAADLIVWPENSVFDVLGRDPAYLDDLRWLAGRKGSWVLVGALGPAEGRPGRTTNRAFLFDQDGRLRGDYAKRVLFPWSERVPLDDWLARRWPWAWRGHRALVRRAWGFVPTGVNGTGPRTLTLVGEAATTRFGCLICNESAYPPLAAAAAAEGARFIVNVTSEGDLGGPVQEQMLRINVLRAVENRVAFVRDGNTGISCFIDPTGRVRSVLHGRRGRTNGDDGVLVDSVALASTPPTLYARSRDGFARLCVLATLIGLVAAVRGRRAFPVAALLLAGSAATGCADVPRIGSDPRAAPAAAARMDALISQRRDASALRLAGDACAAADSCLEALPSAIDAFRRTGAFEVGAAFLDAVAGRYPELRDDLHVYRGVMLHGELDDEAAERELRRAVAVRPSERAFAALGGLLVDDGRPGDAVGVLREGVAFDPASESIRILLGHALWNAGRAAEARGVLEGAVAHAPGDGAAWAELGALLLEQRDLAGASRALERAVDAAPGNIEARRLLGALALRKGAMAEARERLAEVTSLEASLVTGPARR